MITKIKRLKNIGKFYDFATKGSGLDWHKNTFLFAPNAYGKSTLVNVFRSLRENDPKLIRARKTLSSIESPEAVLIVDGVNHIFNGTRWDKSCSEFQIFDVPFVHANILTDEIEHEHRKNIHKIIIGAEGVKLAEELSTLKTQEKSKRQQFERLRSQFNTAGIVHHTLDAFLAIPATEEAAVPLRIAGLEKDIKSKETESQVRTLSLPRPITTPAFDLSSTRTLAAGKLSTEHKAAEKRVLAHIQKNIADKSRAKQFIRTGLDLLQEDCPFCGQDLRTAIELLDAYREFFHEAFRTFQAELSQTMSQLDRWNIENELTSLISSHNANTATVRQWDPYIGKEVLTDASVFVEDARKKLTDSRAKVLAELEKKQKEPNSDCDLSHFDVMVAELKALSAQVDAYNEAVANFVIKAEGYIDELPKSDIDVLRQSLAKEREIEKRFKPEWKRWATDYPVVKKDAADLLRKKDAKQKDLETYTVSIFRMYQKRINELLETLGADFTLTDLTGKTDDRANESYSDFGFLILEKKVPLKARQDDLPCFKNTLSEGDKSSLAFAFFIASLEKTPDLYKQVVILDDPLSSLDDTRREATAGALLELSPKLNQLCVFTHKKDFLWMVYDKIPDNNVLQVRSDKTNGSWIEPLDVEEDRKSKHAKTIEAMQRYVNEDFGQTPDMMQGNIRKAFEVVLKTKFYSALAADIKEKKGLAKILKTLFDAGLLNAGLKPKLFDLCSVASGPHHGEIVDAPVKNLTRNEVCTLIKEALALLEKL
jgi:wobble nucleotide-excising tRNase